VPGKSIITELVLDMLALDVLVFLVVELAALLSWW